MVLYPATRAVNPGAPPRSAQREPVTLEEAFGGDDLVDELARHRHVAGHDHHGQAVVSVVVVGQVPDGRRVDVHLVGAEDRPDPADHAGHVAVAEQRDVVLELEVEALAHASSRCGRARRPSVVPTTLARPSPEMTVTRTRSAKSRALVRLVSTDSMPRSSA